MRDFLKENPEPGNSENSLAHLVAGRDIFRFIRLTGGFEQRDGRGFRECAVGPPVLLTEKSGSGKFCPTL